jgi:hypothetical protein
LKREAKEFTLVLFVIPAHPSAKGSDNSQEFAKNNFGRSCSNQDKVRTVHGKPNVQPNSQFSQEC